MSTSSSALVASFTSSLSDHPLALEISSLHQSLAKFQHVAHTTSMQLQGKVMEITLSKEAQKRLIQEKEVLEAEVVLLRQQASSSTTSSGSHEKDPSVALAELVLAHRKLSAKLDVQEESHSATWRLLGEVEAENDLIRRERENLGVLLLDWKDRVNKLEQELEEQRWKARTLEEEKKLFVIALQGEKISGASTPEVSETTTKFLNIGKPEMPLITPPASDILSPPPSEFHTSPQPCAVALDTEGCAAFASPSFHDSPLLYQGLKEVAQLSSELQQSLANKESKIKDLEAELEIAEAVKQASDEQARNDRSLRDGMATELRSLKADDESASRVVERYMAFTQKTAENLYVTMQNQSQRLGQTIKTLKHQLSSTEKQLNRERDRTGQLRSAIEELAEGYERETFGRRREVSLRIEGITQEESRIEESKRWLEKVRSARNRLHSTMSGNVAPSPMRQRSQNDYYASPARSNTLLSSASTSSLVSLTGSTNPTTTTSAYQHEEQITALWDLLETGVEMFSRHERMPDLELLGFNNGSVAVDSNLGRVLLAQELALGLLGDLEKETMRIVKLEREKIKWIGKHPGEDKSQDENHDRSSMPVDVPSSPTTVAETPLDGTTPADSNQPKFDGEKTPRVAEDAKFDAPSPALQVDDLSHMVTTAVEVDPELADLSNRLKDALSRYSGLQKALHDCAASITSLRQMDLPMPPVLRSMVESLVDALDDVLEDVRVSVEIAIADDQRIIGGHQAVLSLQSKPGHGDLKPLIPIRTFLDSFGPNKNRQSGFEKKLKDLENDLVLLKMGMMSTQEEPFETEDTEGNVNNPFDGLSFRTIRPPRLTVPSTPGPQSEVPRPSPPIGVGNGLRRGFFPALGRSFSGTTPSTTFPRQSNQSYVQLEAQNTPIELEEDGDVVSFHSLSPQTSRSSHGDVE